MAHAARIAADHPCLPGHFPGNPVVPAVVLLEEVEVALSQALARPVRIAALPAVKFIRPLPPDTAFEVALEIDRAASLATFRCTSGGQDLVTGRLSYVG
jgi:3-hydroxyacyl-[acyl-carrier-protein] dehydratase